uniref:Low molecular mass early light-inducible protein HV60 n=1 Tax=Griffithsia japonica TaxID=83288 RepID=Q7XZ09_GRIJA|nr:low molecular mass early light-inducible protein HV60 [Griffithsia japonica]
MGNMVPAFVKAMEDYKADFPSFAERGWGATVKAERWNGRHVMFGWLVFWITAYCKGHGLLPDPSVLLDLSQWGPVASLGDSTPISQQRAIVLVAHIHVLFVSIAAAIAPFSFQDKLLLEPGEADDAPAGLFPPMAPGLTKDAEIWNGRVAMVGLICLVAQAVGTKTPILDVVNMWFGSLFY